jgi:hypothetical protein
MPLYPTSSERLDTETLSFTVSCAEWSNGSQKVSGCRECTQREKPGQRLGVNTAGVLKKTGEKVPIASKKLLFLKCGLEQKKRVDYG